MSFDPNVIEQRAIQLHAKGRKDQAIALYKQLLQRDPSNRRIRKTIADIHMELGETRQAERRYLEVVESMVKDGQFRMAVPIYKELTKLRPKDQDMFVELADCFVKVGKSNDALEMYQKAVEMTQRSKPDVAQNIQRKIIQLCPGEFAERIRLAELLEQANWSEKASDEWKVLANESRRIGKPSDQALFLERALSLREEWDVRRDAAGARLQSGDSKKALVHLQSIYKSHSQDPLVCELLAAGLMKINQKGKAAKVWVQAAERYAQGGNSEKQINALHQAVACGFPKENFASELAAAEELQRRTSINLIDCDWAKPQSTDEYSIILKAQVLKDYQQYRTAQDLLKEKSLGTLAARALSIELLISLGENDRAISELQSFAPPSLDVYQDIQSKLLSLGVAIDSEDDIDDELLEDDLLGADEDDLGGDASDDLVDDSMDLESASTPSTVTSGGSIDALEARASELVAAGQIDEAIDIYGQILDIDPDHDSALIRIGELMSRAPQGEDELLDDGDFTDIDPDDFSFGLAQEEPVEQLSPVHAQANDTEDDQLQQARAYLMVGLYKKAISAVEDREDLHAVCISAQAMLEQGSLRKAKNALQDMMEDASENHPAYKEGLWIMAKILTQQEKVRSVRRLLNELTDLDSSWRSRDVKAWLRGLEYLDS